MHVDVRQAPRGQLDLGFQGDPCPDELGPGASVLRGFALGRAAGLLEEIASIAARSPFRNMVTPGGQRMSAAMTNCGPLGWISDRAGYRYSPVDPSSGAPWPPLPPLFAALAREAASAAGFEDFVPDACLVNRYEPGARMSLHQDKDEKSLGAPIVSVSLGLPVVFLWGGDARADRPRRIALHHGDVVVWGGPARLRYHGVLPIEPGEHPMTGPFRFNLTLRKAG